MSVIGNFTVPAEAFALATAFEAVPEMTVEGDRLASHSTMEVLPFLWVTGGEAETLREALEADAAVESTTVADDTDEGVLFRTQWSEEFRGLVDRMVDHHAAITHAKGAEGSWTLRLRFAEESMISEFQSYFVERGHDFEVHSLRRPDGVRQSELGLTADQRDALATAVRLGYFGVPRETSAEELGEELGISANAASERVRRGTETLIESALLLEGDR